MPLPEKTLHDHDTYEVLSAMQKCVRRGLEDGALYWATELQMSGRAQEGVLWSRILIMASEDVGVASDAGCAENVVLVCEALYRNWKKNPACKVFALHAILALVRAPKSRLTDSAWNYFMAQEKLGLREKRLMPDFALDQHTRRGRIKKRGQLHFWTDGVQLENCTVPDPYEDDARRLMVEAERKGKL